MTDRRGRYPESSSSPKKRKKAPTMGKNYREGVGHGHREYAVWPDEKIPDDRVRDSLCHKARQPGIYELAEKPVLKKVDQRSRREYTHEFVEKKDHGGDYQVSRYPPSC
jgi:hypothetical protein